MFSLTTIARRYGGEQAGNGLADVLFGDVAPSGRLPFTVFKSLEQMKPMDDYDLTTQPGRTHLYYDDSSVARPVAISRLDLGTRTLNATGRSRVTLSL